MLPFLNVWVSHDRDSNTLVTIKGLLEAYSYRPMLALPIVPTPAVKNGISPVQEGLPRLHFSESRVGAAHLSLKQNGYPYHLICPHYPISTNMDQPEPKATVSIPFVKGVSERIKRIFAKRGIRVYFRSGRTLDSLLSYIRPKRDPMMTGVWSTKSLAWTVTNLTLEKLEEPLKPGSLNTRGVARMGKCQDHAWHSIM